MSDLDQLPKINIDVRCLDGTHKVKAWRVAEHFGVHQMLLTNGLYGMEWVVTHLPSGISLGPYFWSAQDAAGAALDVAKLRNDWDHFDPATVTQAFRQRIRDVFKAWDAIPATAPNTKLLNERGVRDYAADLNGYENNGGNQ